MTMTMTMKIELALSLTLALAAAGCSDSVFGPPTESVCPPGSTLTWTNFGQKFMTDYCTRCHDSKLMGAARQGAPSFHDFETRSGVMVVRNHIDETTASGPAATNTGMPPAGPKPTLEERQKLGEWLACGVPE
jgi:hypothetical protein